MNPFISDILVEINPVYTVNDPTPDEITEYLTNSTIAQEAYFNIMETSQALDLLANASISYTQLCTSAENLNIDKTLFSLVTKTVGRTISIEDAIISMETVGETIMNVGKQILDLIMIFIKKVLNFLGIMRTHSDKELSRSKKVTDKIQARINKEGNVRFTIKLTDSEMRWLYVHGNNGPSTHVSSDLAKAQKIAGECIDEVLNKIDSEIKEVALINEVSKIHAIRDALHVFKKETKEYIIGDVFIHVNDNGNAYTLSKGEESQGGNKEYETDLNTAKTIVAELVITKKFVKSYSSKIESKTKRLESDLKSMAEKAGSTADAQLRGALNSVINEIKGMLTDSLKIVKHMEDVSSHILNIYDKAIH